MANNNAVANPVNDKPASVPQHKRVPFAVSEAYKGIRTNLISLLKNGNKRIVLISSPNASEGKSTTSINTAISLSQLNKKILLIDTDAHRPSVHHKLKLDNSDGLMNVILGLSEFNKAIKHYNQTLDILTTGPIPSNATECFSDPEFEALLARLRDEYDYIILDAPPVNLLSDSLVMAQQCDGMILIIRAGITTHESMRKALESVKVLNINLLGVILNGSEHGTKKYYKGGYKYKYKSYGPYGSYGHY